MKKSPAELQRERERLIEDELSHFLQQNNSKDSEDFRPDRMSQTQFQELYGKLQQNKSEAKQAHCSKNTPESKKTNNDCPATRRIVELSAEQEKCLYSFRKTLREKHKSLHPFNDEDIIRILIDLIPELKIPKNAKVNDCHSLKQVLKSVMNSETKS
jgi:hypothetical protein